jgi:hypothetical protein
MDHNEMNRLLLTQLVMMFQSAALQQMGKLKDPRLDKIDQNLEQAQISIDMIAMMQAKMKGNLAPEEDRMFSSVLQDLRLNYVDEVGKKQQASPTAPPPAPETTPAS